ncbi:MAG TPA: VIT and VWA domain-containing protein [Planctomycetota bacterium]
MAFVVALAQDTSGTLIPAGGGPPMEIESQEVRVRINNGIAVTTITQVFRNNRPQALEAVYAFPVPHEASVSNFSMWISGKEVVGEVLEKKEARRIYESITAQRRDPGLLEQVSYKLFEVRVFPVPANGTQKIQIAYYQPVQYDTGFGQYVYPLEAKTREASRVRGSFKVDVDLISDLPLKSVSSPSHARDLAVKETSPGRWRASMETPRGAIDRDFVLVYEQERETTGLRLVPSRIGGDDGHFLLLLTAGKELEKAAAAVNYTLLLDVSGSMGDQRKLDHALRMIDELVRGMDARDRFNVLTFNIATEALFADGPSLATEENRKKAFDFLRGQRARGGTDLIPALEAAAGQRRDDMANVLVLLSDGNATDTDDHARFRRLLDGKGGSVRVFSIGIGNEVNRPLLTALAQATGGYSDFVSSSDDADRKTRLLKSKILHQVAEKLELKIAGVRTYDVVPERLPNLFRGQQLAVYGRYQGKGPAKLTVSGMIGGVPRSIDADIEFPGEERDNPEVRRMWAWKRSDALMNEIRAEGESASKVRAVTALGTEYSIVTPYTSFLVLENDQQYRQFGIEQRNARQIAEDRAAQDRRAAEPFARTTSSGGGGGGGSVELGFLALVGALAGVRAWRKRAA